MSTTYHGHVVRIVDGDTIDVSLEVPLPAKRITWGDRLHLSEIDVPEPSEDAIRGQQAVQFIEQWLTGAGKLSFVIEEARDKYGRLIGEVISESGECLAKAMIARGLGKSLISETQSGG